MLKYNVTYKAAKITDEEVKRFEKVNSDLREVVNFELTGETLTERIEEVTGLESREITYVVIKVKGKNWTPYQMCRDCGDHYIIARWDRYDRIDKATLERTCDVEDR